MSVSHVSTPPAHTRKGKFIFWDPCPLYPIRTENSGKRRSCLLVNSRDQDPPVLVATPAMEEHRNLQFQHSWWRLMTASEKRKTKAERATSKEKKKKGVVQVWGRRAQGGDWELQTLQEVSWSKDNKHSFLSLEGHHKAVACPTNALRREGSQWNVIGYFFPLSCVFLIQFNFCD